MHMRYIIPPLILFPALFNKRYLCIDIDFWLKLAYFAKDGQA